MNPPTSHRGPQTYPEGPKRPPSGPRYPQKPPPETAKVSQGGPEGPQETPWGAQREQHVPPQPPTTTDNHRQPPQITKNIDFKSGIFKNRGVIPYNLGRSFLTAGIRNGEPCIHIPDPCAQKLTSKKRGVFDDRREGFENDMPQHLRTRIKNERRKSSGFV